MSTERERLMKLMETEGLNAKQFANEVGIQAGTISNIVNGRNKPSLEVLQKVLHRFRTVSSDWMILDFGSMYRPIGEAQSRTLFDELPVEPPMIVPSDTTTQEASDSQSVTTNHTPSIHNTEASLPSSSSSPANHKQIDKIVIFYSDGTYENFCH